VESVVVATARPEEETIVFGSGKLCTGKHHVEFVRSMAYVATAFTKMNSR